MRILIVHNHYGNYAIGGEANVMFAEAELLKESGFDVHVFECSNSGTESGDGIEKLLRLYHSQWSPIGYKMIEDVIKDVRPDVMHVHNYWYQLSPSIFKAAHDNGVATVFTLHNYRLLCPGVLFLRNNGPCEYCLTGNAWRSLFFRCHSNNFLKTLLSFRCFNYSRKRKRLADIVDRYIALSNFMRSKMIEGGIPGEQINVKPNFIKDPLIGKEKCINSRGAVFVGRISPEKGLDTLLQAWSGTYYPLTIIGGRRENYKGNVVIPSSVTFAGKKSREEVLYILSKASFLVFPSACYEGFPLSILEAMAIGKPILASDLGGRKEMVIHGKTGLLFKVGDTKDLCDKAKILAESPELCETLGANSRKKYLEEYSPNCNLNSLIEIYQEAISFYKGRTL